MGMEFFALMSWPALWLTCLVFAVSLRKRGNFLCRIILFALVSVLLGIFFARVTPTWPQIPARFLYATVFFLACTRMGWRPTMYGGVWVTVIQQFSVELLLCAYFRWQPAFHVGVWGWILAVLSFVGSLAVIGLTLARWMPVDGSYEVGPRQLSSALFLLVLFVALAYLLLHGIEDPPLFYVLTIVLAQLFCINMLYLQDALFRKSAMRHELQTLNRIWYEQKQQYQLAKDTIAIINHKCHDLKHQIAAMRAISGPEEREKYLEEIERSVGIYDSIYQTGNEVLDTVLTEKSLSCEARHITMSCVADGSKLDFLDPVDLYCILGNALDNAMESVQDFEPEDRRIIDLLICAERQFLTIRVVNPLSGQLTFQDGLPLSTKGDDAYHGFGLRSIRHTVEKYGGCVNVGVKNGCFGLSILIPYS